MTAILTAPSVFSVGNTAGDQTNALVGQLITQINALLGARTINTVNNAAGQTITAAQIVAGVYIATGRGAAQTDTTDTAVNLFAALQAAALLSPAALIASAFAFRYINGSANTVTIAGGTNVTPGGTGATSVAAGTWCDYVVTFSSPTVCAMTTIGKGTYA